MKTKPKLIKIEIEFGSFEQMQYALNQIAQMAKHGQNSGRFKSNECLINYQMNYITEIDYREELIDGKLCQIFKSKM